MPLSSRLAAAAQLVASTRDVLDARPHDGEPPAPLLARGWSALLASLTDDELATLEVHGLEAAWPARTPASLLTLIAEARAVCAVDAADAADAAESVNARSPTPQPPALRLRETPRKRAQIEAFARAIVPLASHARRVVDVGAGHGHLTRDLAERLALPVVGLERDPAIVRRAASLPSDASPEFLATDVLRDGLAFEADDCVVGLHACGELGDAIVEAAAACDVAGAGGARGARAAAVALVGCCLQKRRQPARLPLCSDTPHARQLALPTSLLGLSNLTPRDEGVEASRESNLDARARRLALRGMLAQRGLVLSPGAEMDGVNRRTAQRDLASLVARVFAHRGLPAPSAEDVAEADRGSRATYARMRRFSLPRALLGRALEVYVALDRACFLEAHGFEVRVAALFPTAVSARNLVILARRSAPA